MKDFVINLLRDAGPVGLGVRRHDGDDAGVMVAASCWSLLIPAIDSGGVAGAWLVLSAWAVQP